MSCLRSSTALPFWNASPDNEQRGTKVPLRNLLSFGSLAPGTYFLGLMGLPAELRGRILNSPGFLEPTPEQPRLSLDAIRIER